MQGRIAGVLGVVHSAQIRGGVGGRCNLVLRLELCYARL